MKKKVVVRLSMTTMAVLNIFRYVLEREGLIHGRGGPAEIDVVFLPDDHKKVILHYFMVKDFLDAKTILNTDRPPKDWESRAYIEQKDSEMNIFDVSLFHEGVKIPVRIVLRKKDGTHKYLKCRSEYLKD